MALAELLIKALEIASWEEDYRLQQPRGTSMDEWSVWINRELKKKIRSMERGRM